jgi:hypothetical protein
MNQKIKTSSSKFQKRENMKTSPVDQYFVAIELFLREWDQNFRDYDINDYLYDDQEDIIYGLMDKFYTRIRTVKGVIPKEIKPKGLPSLRKLENEYMHEDSDLHLSDYESFIYVPLNKILQKRENYITT